MVLLLLSLQLHFPKCRGLLPVLVSRKLVVPLRGDLELVVNFAFSFETLCDTLYASNDSRAGKVQNR